MLHTLGITLTLSASRAFQHLHRICFVPFQGFDFAAWNSIHCIYWRSSKLHIYLMNRWPDSAFGVWGELYSFWRSSVELHAGSEAQKTNFKSLLSSWIMLAWGQRHLNWLPHSHCHCWQPRVRNPLRRKLENLHSRLFSKKINSCGRLWNYSSGNIEQLWI